MLLSERQERILRLLVREYIATMRAVGSKTVVERGGFDFSSATVRNDMAALERLGYIQQAHTSGGRTPTDAGYRYYVERLMDQPMLSTNEQMLIRHQFHQVEVHLDDWIKLAASVLARVAGNVSVVTTPRARLPRVKHLELIPVQERTALLVLVTREGAVRQAMVTLPDSADQTTLRAVADSVGTRLAGQGRTEVMQTAALMGGLDRLIADETGRMLRNLEEAMSAEVVHDGLGNILQQPEFGGHERASRLVELLRGGALLTALLPQLLVATEESGHVNSVQVIIGAENQWDALQDFGIVLATYGIPSEVTGMVAVLGPTRMYYERTISSVRYVSQVLSDLLTELYTTRDPRLGTGNERYEGR
jgi:heat-inducible transcriptional repressor